MTPRPLAPIAEAAPLLVAPELAKLARLEAERETLKARIAALPRHAHARVVLEARLQDATTAWLRASLALRRAG